MIGQNNAPIHEYHPEFLHSMIQVRDLEAKLSTTQAWEEKEVQNMAQQLAIHAHLYAKPFIQHFHPQLADSAIQQKLQMYLQLSLVADANPRIQALKQSHTLLEALYATEGYFFAKGDKRADVLVVVFTTVYNNFGVSNLFLYALLQEVGVSVLMLRDLTRANYLGGALGMGSNLDETAQAIERFANEKQCKHILIMGYSSGGFGSCYVARKIACSAYLGFSILTDFSLDTPLPTLRFISRELRQQFDPKYLISLANMSVEALPPTPARLLVGENDQDDRGQAQAMKDVPNLEVLELPGFGHDLPDSLICSDGFMPHIHWMLSHAR